MLHAIMGLLDNLAHIDSYLAYTTMMSGMADTYTASNKCSVPDKGPAIQD